MIRKALFMFLLLLVCALLETALLSNIFFLPAVPDILLLVVLYIAVNNGSLAGESAGFISGLLLDFLSTAPLGLNCLLRTIIGFVTGLFHNSLNVKGVFVPAILALIVTVAKAILIGLISFFFPAGIVTYDFFSVRFGVELLLNAVFAPLVFTFLSCFSSYLVRSREEAS